MKRTAALVCLLLVWVPFMAAAQTSAGEQAETPPEGNRPRRLSVHAAAGATLPHGDQAWGNIWSVAFGYSATSKLTLLASVGQTHQPTHIQRFRDGVSAATRGGTLRFVSGEARFALRSGDRVSPYVMAGGGAGISRPNVNEMFPDPVTNNALVFFGGGGLAVPLGPRLLVSGDIGFWIVGERDVIEVIPPIRGSVAWRF